MFIYFFNKRYYKLVHLPITNTIELNKILIIILGTFILYYTNIKYVNITQI